MHALSAYAARHEGYIRCGARARFFHACRNYGGEREREREAVRRAVVTHVRLEADPLASSLRVRSRPDLGAYITPDTDADADDEPERPGVKVDVVRSPTNAAHAFPVHSGSDERRVASRRVASGLPARVSYSATVLAPGKW